MGEHESVRGTCLCGAVTLTAHAVEEYGACHCGMCRKWGGGPLMAVDCGQTVRIEGEGSVGVFDSSPWAERGFCTKCGTHLFYRLKGNQEYHVPVGLFGDAVTGLFSLQVFIDKKPESYAFANQTETMTEAEIFEQYAPKD